MRKLIKNISIHPHFHVFSSSAAVVFFTVLHAYFQQQQRQQQQQGIVKKSREGGWVPRGQSDQGRACCPLVEGHTTPVVAEHYTPIHTLGRKSARVSETPWFGLLPPWECNVAPQTLWDCDGKRSFLRKASRPTWQADLRRHRHMSNQTGGLAFSPHSLMSRRYLQRGSIVMSQPLPWSMKHPRERVCTLKTPRLLSKCALPEEKKKDERDTYKIRWTVVSWSSAWSLFKGWKASMGKDQVTQQYSMFNTLCKCQGAASWYNR